jgi:hypothetical protein
VHGPLQTVIEDIERRPPHQARPRTRNIAVTATKTATPRPADAAASVGIDDEVAYLAKRHRISPAIVREIIRRIGSAERSAVEREIKKGMARR